MFLLPANLRVGYVPPLPTSVSHLDLVLNKYFHTIYCQCFRLGATIYIILFFHSLTTCFGPTWPSSGDITVLDCHTLRCVYINIYFYFNTRYDCLYKRFYKFSKNIC
jgi:hypothetical protein